MKDAPFRHDRGVYLITEHQRLDFPELLARTETALAAGVAALQYRNKAAGARQRLEEAERLQALCRAHGTPLIINDDLELAARIGADGVHLGRRDSACRAARARLGPEGIIGVSCYNEIERAGQAAADGADYVAFGAMFPTASKAGATPASPGVIREARRLYDLPVAAIGGITPGNCGPLIEAGADLLAVISSVYLAEDPAAAVKAFNDLLKTRAGGRDATPA